MSATNHTANYELSQYIGSDEPKYLTDYNGDMSKIDVAIKSADTKAETANTGVATNASAISTLDTAVGSLQTQVTTVAGIANGNTGSINTINSLIGNGQPTTTDKTLIGAINEINARTGEASGITYENTTSGLVATNVQSAIDEVVTMIPTPGTIEADDVEYDNTTSGLTATNVQSAIDELASAAPVVAEHGVYELWANADITQDFAAQNIVLTDFDSTKYDAIIVVFETYKNEGTGGHWREVDRAVLDIPNYTLQIEDTTFVPTSGRLYYASRTFTFSLSGTTLTIAVSGGKQGHTQSFATMTLNDEAGSCIPIRIIGLAHNA